jgi:hypothetical protein
MTEHGRRLPSYLDYSSPENEEGKEPPTLVLGSEADDPNGLDQVLPLGTLPPELLSQRSECAPMEARSPLFPTFFTLLLCCSVLCTGCSSLIAYSGKNVGGLENRGQVRESFGTPSKSGTDDYGYEFDEYHTHRKTSEPNAAGARLILGVQTLGLLELWMFPVSIYESTWTTLFGDDLRFLYKSDGNVEIIQINGMSMEARGWLP